MEYFGKRFAFPSLYPLVVAGEAHRDRRCCCRTHRSCCCRCGNAAPWRGVWGEGVGGVLVEKEEAGVLKEMPLSLRCKYVRQVFSLGGKTWVLRRRNECAPAPLTCSEGTRSDSLLSAILQDRPIIFMTHIRSEKPQKYQIRLGWAVMWV